MDRTRRTIRIAAGVGLFLLLIAPLSVLGVDGAASDMTIDFVAVDAEVTRLLFFFAEYGGLNIIVDPSVSGTVSVSLTRVEPVVAFSIVLDLAELEAYEVDGTLYITSKNR